MFEPLRDMIGHHAENLQEALNHVIDRLDVIATNTISTVEYNEFYTHGKNEESNAEGTATIEFKPKEGLSWKVSRVGVTQNSKGSCAVYVNTISPENLVDVIAGAINTDRPRYLVARGSILIFHFYEQGEKQRCTANVQAEQFSAGVRPRKAVKGQGNDGGIDIINPPGEVPSGHPLEGVQEIARKA